MAKELAKSNEEELKALALQNEEYEQYAGQGLDDLSQEDKGLPFFEIIQPMSPEVEEIGAKPGQIINKATKELLDELIFVPVVRAHVYTEWVPRDKGGGLVATHELNSTIVVSAREKQKVGKHVLPNDNELIETFYLYGLVLDNEGNPMPAVIAFTSTKISAYKQLTTRADSLMFRAKDGRKLKYPWFAHAWKLTTEKKKKDKWTWWTWNVAFNGPNDKADEARLAPSDPAFQLGSDLYQSFRQGQVKVNTEGMTNDGPADNRSPGERDLEDDNPPF